jgi:predicted CXXCH cytochrome family protein
MKEQLSTFIVVREDRGLDPTNLVAAGLSIGRAADRDLVLNHPDVSRVHAGIREIDGRFYLFNLSRSNSTTLNGGLVELEKPQVMEDGDQLRIGPFFLRIARQDGALQITVTLQFGLRIGDIEARTEAPTGPLVLRESVMPAPAQVAHALDLFWGKRSREKAARPSPLHPRRPPRLGKARFNWAATRDLVRPWPFAIFLWAAILLAAFSIAAAFGYTAAFAPEPISEPHGRAAFAMNPAIANHANGGSCTSCHSLRAGMAGRCASCHTTDAFVGSVTKSHADAGIGCLDCHTEHKGKEPQLLQSALNSCVRCHSDKNKNTYNGKSVKTPHGGTLGYPVVADQWQWKGLDVEELAVRPKIAAKRVDAAGDEQRWRSIQFHALHIYNVRATGGVAGVQPIGSSGPPVLSCSSCHATYANRNSPRQTCAGCHNGLIDFAGRVLVPAGAPDCISCHVQHVKDKRHWNPDLLATAPATPLMGR